MDGTKMKRKEKERRELSSLRISREKENYKSLTPACGLW